MSETNSPQTQAERVADRAVDVSDPAGGAAGSADVPAPRSRRIGLLVLTALVVLVADVVSKALVVAMLSDRPPKKVLGGLVYLTETRNSGAAFSFAEGATVVFSLIAVAVIVVILRTARRLRSAPWALCLGLILGGASGNLVDRLARSPGPLRGAVVDWISVLDPNGGVWPIFNLADSGIVSGGVLAILLATFGHEIDGRRARGGASGTPDGDDQGDGKHTVSGDTVPGGPVRGRTGGTGGRDGTGPGESGGSGESGE